MTEKTVYTLKINGRPKGSFGRKQDFLMTLLMDGACHPKEMVKLNAYIGANYIHKLEILNKKPYREIELNEEQYDILCHTVDRAPGHAKAI